MKIKQERERKEKRKEKVTSTKLEVCTPHTHTTHGWKGLQDDSNATPEAIFWP